MQLKYKVQGQVFVEAFHFLFSFSFTPRPQQNCEAFHFLVLSSRAIFSDIRVTEKSLGLWIVELEPNKIGEHKRYSIQATMEPRDLLLLITFFDDQVQIQDQTDSLYLDLPLAVYDKHQKILLH